MACAVFLKEAGIIDTYKNLYASKFVRYTDDIGEDAMLGANALAVKDCMENENMSAFVKSSLDNYFSRKIYVYQPKKNAFHNFMQRDYDFEELEKVLLSN